MEETLPWVRGSLLTVVKASGSLPTLCFELSCIDLALSRPDLVTLGSVQSICISNKLHGKAGAGSGSALRNHSPREPTKKQSRA